MNTPGVAGGARKAKAANTRAKIFAAAASLFAKHGYQVTTVDRIAAEAGVAKGTFFVHFKSKDAVAAELVGVQTRGARKERDRVLAEEGPLAALKATVMTLGKHGAASRALSRGVLTAVLDSKEVGGRVTELLDAVFEDMATDARAAQGAGLLRADADAETLARSLLVGYLGAVLSFSSNPKRDLLALLGPIVDSHLLAARPS